MAELAPIMTAIPVMFAVTGMTVMAMINVRIIFTMAVSHLDILVTLKAGIKPFAPVPGRLNHTT
jgi:hypothetical protein